MGLTQCHASHSWPSAALGLQLCGKYGLIETLRQSVWEPLSEDCFPQPEEAHNCTTDRKYVSNEATFNIKPWVLCCFCFHQIDLRELLGCHVWEYREKKKQFIFHLLSWSSKLSISVQGSQQGCKNVSMATSFPTTEQWLNSPKKKSLSLLDTAGGATLNVELTQQALALQFTDYHSSIFNIYLPSEW